MKKVLTKNWQLAIVENQEVLKSNFNPKTAKEVLNSGFEIIKATVPGNFELDLINAGKLEDLYFGENILKAQEFENRHLYYCLSFEFDFKNKKDFDAFLNFKGIDTVAEIYLNGKLIGFTENMFIEHKFKLNEENTKNGINDLLVHILPSEIYSRKFSLTANRAAHPWSYNQLILRKAPYMFGWDIMPRVISGGLWREAEIDYVPKTNIKNCFLFTHILNTANKEENKGCNNSRNDKNDNNNYAQLRLVLDFCAEDDFLTDYYIRISGKCKNSKFCSTLKVYSLNGQYTFDVNNALLWWPKNYGEQNLYNVTVELIKIKSQKFKTLSEEQITEALNLNFSLKTAENTQDDFEVLDFKNFNFGIRTVYLQRTSVAKENGKFEFSINGKPIFAMGTNWVPTDVFPSRNKEYTLRVLKYADDLGCNIIRCWGGGIYPDEEFYSFCDEHGILVWQDFAMACGRYPLTERMKNLIKEEVEWVVKKLRNHASLLVWSGDNECDETLIANAVFLNGQRLLKPNPNLNELTRNVIPFVLNEEDYTRPYLPSSPYFDEEAFLNWPNPPSETHMWGPRDFFKGDFYKNNNAHFISETGYHGCPSPKSLKKFLSDKAYNDLNAFNNKECLNEEWNLHCTSPFKGKNENNYRVPLMVKQIEVLFKTVEKSREDFARQSQISHAEAQKYLIERMRIKKGHTFGIIWWNLADGWPQFSEAAVDWYGCKKLAYGYIKRSQSPFCIMCDEPQSGYLTVVACNDTVENVSVDFKITGINSDNIVARGKVTVGSGEVLKLGKFFEEDNEMYKIEWSGTQSGINHYTASIYKSLNYKNYLNQLKKIGFYNEFEGF